MFAVYYSSPNKDVIAQKIRKNQKESMFYSSSWRIYRRCFYTTRGVCNASEASTVEIQKSSKQNGKEDGFSFLETPSSSSSKTFQTHLLWKEK